MQKSFLDILNIARVNVQKNPSIVGVSTEEIADRYLQGLVAETKEVEAEVKTDNHVYLADELSDIAWDYTVLLALLEDRGYIKSVGEIFEHAHAKYSERSQAFQEANNALWDKVKSTQKENLRKKHHEEYGT